MSTPPRRSLQGAHLPAIEPADVQNLLRRPGSIRTVFQPIVDLRTSRIVGHEALSRVTVDPPASATAWFGAARQMGAIGLTLEVKALTTALMALPRMPSGQFLALNLSLAALAEHDVHRLLEPLDLNAVVLEITEHDAAPAGPLAGPRLGDLRRRGLRVAVDDVGTGYSNLTRVLDLRPDLIKIDRRIVQGCTDDPSRQTVVQMVARLAGTQGGQVVAEGIETRRDRATIERLGVGLGQGHLFGRPSPVMEGELRSGREAPQSVADSPWSRTTTSAISQRLANISGWAMKKS